MARQLVRVRRYELLCTRYGTSQLMRAQVLANGHTSWQAGYIHGWCTLNHTWVYMCAWLVHVVRMAGARGAHGWCTWCAWLVHVVRMAGARGAYGWCAHGRKHNCTNTYHGR